MVSPERKAQLMQEGAQAQREKWGRPLAEVLASAVDDIRARVVEEGWFGKPQFDVGSEVSKVMEAYGDQLYGRQSAADISQSAEFDQAHATDIERDESAER